MILLHNFLVNCHKLESIFTHNNNNTLSVSFILLLKVTLVMVFEDAKNLFCLAKGRSRYSRETLCQGSQWLAYQGFWHNNSPSVWYWRRLRLGQKSNLIQVKPTQKKMFHYFWFERGHCFLYFCPVKRFIQYAIKYRCMIVSYFKIKAESSSLAHFSRGRGGFLAAPSLPCQKYSHNL